MTLDPYPFVMEPLEGTVPGLTLPKAVFSDDADYRSALQAAEPATLRFRLARTSR